MNSNSTAPAEIAQKHPILLFDGVCNLCNGLVQFVIERDPDGLFRFASLQSEVGRTLSREAGLNPGEMGTAILFHQGRYYYKSDMALQVAGQLGGFWRLFRIFQWIPKGLRDGVYDWVARNRYRWFGRKEACMIPTPDLRDRFLDND